jgi:hypothetical protein
MYSPVKGVEIDWLSLYNVVFIIELIEKHKEASWVGMQQEQS